MVSLNEIEKEILELEKKDTSWAVVERLSWLYVVRDHMRPSTAHEAAPEEAVTDKMTGSDFLEAASGVSYTSLMEVLNEHMEAIRVVCPKEYDSVVSKIRSLN